MCRPFHVRFSLSFLLHHACFLLHQLRKPARDRNAFENAFQSAHPGYMPLSYRNREEASLDESRRRTFVIATRAARLVESLIGSSSIPMCESDVNEPNGLARRLPINLCDCDKCMRNQTNEVIHSPQRKVAIDFEFVAHRRLEVRRAARTTSIDSTPFHFSSTYATAWLSAVARSNEMASWRRIPLRFCGKETFQGSRILT